MDNAAEDPCTLRQEFPEELPSLIRHITAHGLTDFDSLQGAESNSSSLQRRIDSQGFSVSAREAESVGDRGGGWKVNTRPNLEGHARKQSISMPPSPTGKHLQPTKRVLFCDHHPSLLGPKKKGSDDVAIPISPAAPRDISTAQSGVKYFSQPMPKGALYLQSENPPRSFSPQQQPSSATSTGRDTRFDSFKTWSGKLERQLTLLRGKPVEPEPEQRTHHIDGDALPVDRYFDALEGPELETLRASEEAVLPNDRKWPFLLRFPISSFGICLGTSSQAILWKNLATTMSTEFLHVNLWVNKILWFISVGLVLTVFSAYFVKLIFYFEAVRREYYHPVRVNFFFAPWIALLFLCLGVPPSIASKLPHPLWYVLMTPFLILELKIYGQWMSGGQRRLSKVANPTNHLSIVGNFVGALLGASMGLKEGPIFFFAVGMAHYTVLFVTLYQRLPTNETLPKELHPVFFLFVAAPSVASLAWSKIQGSFDTGSRIAYFIALFLYFSLAVRVNFFRGFKFSLAWWAYTFPMTGAAIATVRYSNEVTSWFTKTLAVVLTAVSTLIVTGLLVSTMVHAFILRDLFPNDKAIAISDRPPIRQRKWFQIGNGRDSSDLFNNDIENFLKFVDSEGKEIEIAVDQNGKSVDVPSESDHDSGREREPF